MKIYNIFNKNAKNFSKKELHEILKIFRASSDITPRGAATNGLSHLETILRRDKNLNPDVLGLGGGDGTISQTLTLINDIWGYIPETVALYAMGTKNNLATIFGLHGFQKDALIRKLGLIMGETEPMKLARYIADNDNLETEEIDLLDINGRKGFNAGFGVIPKLIWNYYGKAMDRYLRLEKDLENVSEKDFQQEVDLAYNEQDPSNGFVDIMNNGKPFKGPLPIMKTAADVFFDGLKKGSHLRQPIDADIYVDGKKITERPTMVYISKYEQANFGFEGFWPIPTPEARETPGKMQVAMSWSSPMEIFLELHKVFDGRRMENNCHYFMAEEVRLEGHHPLMCQVDAEIMAGNTIEVKHDKRLKVISPYQKAA